MRLLDFISDKAGVFAAIAAIIMAILGTLDVIGTAFFSRPITGAVEFSSMLLVCVFFLGMADSVSKEENIAVDLLLNRLTGWKRRLLEALNAGFTLVFFLIFTYLSWRLALHSIDKGDTMGGAISFVLWPFKLVAAVGVTLATVALIAGMLRRARAGDTRRGDG